MSTESRYAGATVDTLADLRQRLDSVIADPELGGFDCMLSKDLLTTQEVIMYQHALLWGKGVRVRLFASSDESTPTHWAARVVIVRPDRIDGDGNVIH